MSEEWPWKPSDLPSPFFVRHADALFAACEQAIRAGRIDARSPMGDAALDYREERDEMAARQAALAAARQVDDATVERAAVAAFEGALDAAYVAKGRELTYTEEGWLRAALRAALAPAADEGEPQA